MTVVIEELVYVDQMSDEEFDAMVAEKVLLAKSKKQHIDMLYEAHAENYKYDQMMDAEWHDY